MGSPDIILLFLTAVVVATSWTLTQQNARQYEPMGKIIAMSNGAIALSVVFVALEKAWGMHSLLASLAINQSLICWRLYCLHEKGERP